MRKHFFSFLALIFIAQFAWAVTSPADIPAYWSSVNGMSGENLFKQLSTATAVGYSSIGYNGLWSAYAKTDVYPADSVDRAGEIWDTYSACHFKLSDHGSYSKECDRYNREHSVPQSWWGSGTSNQGCDIFHVLPTDGYVNNWRGNNPYGEVSSANKTSTNGCKSGPSARAGYSGTVFEPADQYKGDIARGILGAMVKWKGNWTQSEGNSTFTGTYTAAGHFGLTQYAVDLFMKWHREDPISRKEVDRNNGIQETQGNRNPFIDYPYLAEFIWGERAGETVDMSLLMPSTDPEFILGVSNGWRGDTIPPVPPTPATKYGVTWTTNGKTLYVDSIAENQKPDSLPEAPASCSEESNVFMGWTDAPISGTTDEEPAVLYAKLAEFPAVTEDVTYYAVFAKKTTEESENAEKNDTIIFSSLYTTTTEVTSVEGTYMTITFAKGSASNPPKYYPSGEAVRVYGGGTMTVTAENITKIDLTFGSGDNTNVITTNVGSYEEPTWTGAADEVVFSVGGSSGHRKIASVAVTMNGSGTVESYSRYITSCQGPTEVELVGTKDASVRKILVGGHLFILRDGNIYNLQGTRVR